MTAAFWGLFALLAALLAVRTGYGKFTRPAQRAADRKAAKETTP